MNPYIYPATCSVCGGEGVMHAGDIGADWLYPTQHRDPAVCAENLRRERERLKQLGRNLFKAQKQKNDRDAGGG